LYFIENLAQSSMKFPSLQGQVDSFLLSSFSPSKEHR